MTDIILNEEKFVKVHEDVMYEYYVSKEQDFKNGVAAAEVYAIWNSSKNRSVKKIKSCVITEDFKTFVPACTYEHNQYKTKALKYLSICWDNTKMVRIGIHDFLVTVLDISCTHPSTVHVRVDDYMNAIVVAKDLPNLIPTNAPGLALTEVKTGFQLYDVDKGILLDTVYSKVYPFNEEEKDGKTVWRAIVEDEYSTGNTLDDIEDTAYFKIDEHGNITTPIYFKNDNGIESMRIETNAPGFNYAVFKRQKLEQMMKTKETKAVCNRMVEEGIKKKVAELK